MGKLVFLAALVLATAAFTVPAFSQTTISGGVVQVKSGAFNFMPYYSGKWGVTPSSVSATVAPVSTAAANYTVTSSDVFVVIKSTAARDTVFLPLSTATYRGRVITVIKTDTSTTASGKDVRVMPAANDTLNYSVSAYILSGQKYLNVIADSAGHWYVFGSN